MLSDSVWNSAFLQQISFSAHFAPLRLCVKKKELPFLG
jgi:hypothetical protein